MNHLNATSAQVSAIAAGATVLLLPMKPQPRQGKYADGTVIDEYEYFVWEAPDSAIIPMTKTAAYRLAQYAPFLPGQRVGVRERWGLGGAHLLDPCINYEAGGQSPLLKGKGSSRGLWFPSHDQARQVTQDELLYVGLHKVGWMEARSMPDWAIRTWLNITACEPVKEEDVWKWQVRFTVEGR